MADTTSIRKVLNSFRFGRDRASGMHTDMPIEMQPEGTFRNAWGISNQTCTEKGGGVYSAAGMEACVKFPSGAVKRGEVHIKERDQMVVFLDIGGKSEIGYWSTQDCVYKKVIDDSDIEGCDLGFGTKEWIPIVYKFMRNGTCNECHLYWSNARTYKTLNLDRPCVPIACDEINLFNCKCLPAAKANTTEKGGFDLEAGAYQYFAQLQDEDGNTTNWFSISNPVYVGSKNNRPGEASDQAVNVVVDTLSPDYPYVNLGCIKTVAGAKSAFVIGKLSYSPNGATFFHRSRSQRLYDLNIEEILVKNPGYISGNDLFQHNNTLYLFNTYPDRDPDMQARIIDSVRAKIKVGRVPIRYAHMFSGLQRDSVLSFGLNYNYCDGRKTRAYTIAAFGTMPTAGAGCNECEDDNFSNNGARTSIDGKPYENEIIKGADEYTPFTETKTNILSGADFDIPDDKQFIPETGGGGEGNPCACWAFNETLRAQMLGHVKGNQDFHSVYQIYKDLCESGCGDAGEDDNASGGLTPRSIEDQDIENSGCNCFDNSDLSNILLIYNAELGVNAQEEISDESLIAWWGYHSGQTYSSSPCGPCEGGGPAPTPSPSEPDPRFKTVDDMDWTNGEKPSDDEITNSTGQGEGGNNVNTTNTNQTGSSESAAQSSNHGPIQIRPCEPTIVYADSDCCVIKEIIPCIDDEMEPIVYLSCERYPDEERCCNEGKTYGVLAGKRIQHFKMPSLAQQPHFVSYSDGVPSAEHRDNHEYNNGFARFLWLEFSGIPLPDPEELDVPLCPHNPFTIVWEERQGADDTVVASGVLFGTFEGETLGETMLFPNHGTNSAERVDRWINNNGSHRTNLVPTVPAYTFLSPDTSFDRPSVKADYMHNALTLTGRGWRHGLYAEGLDPENSYTARKNRKGARASMNLNKWEQVPGNDIRCVKASSYVDANKVLDKADEFSRTLCNLNRESCVYIETDGARIDMVDTSFSRDVANHQAPLTGTAQYVSLNRYVPNAYGGITDTLYYPLWQGSSADFGEDGTATVLVRAGDSFINYWSVKRTSYVSNHVAPHPRGIKPNFEFGGGISLGWPFKAILRALFSTISADCECGTVPHGGNGLRDPRASNALNGSGTDDRYFPQVQTQLISVPVESRVNLGFQGSGDDPAQSTYRDLNGQVFDSSFDGGDGAYERSWMDRYHASMCENPKWKCLLRTFFNLVFTYVVGVILILKGAKILTDGLTGTEVGFVFTVLSVVAIGLGILLMLAGFIWIIGWANTDLDNRMIDNILGISDCFPDKLPKRGGGDGDAEMKDSRVRGFEDNYYEYNYDFSETNKIEAILGLPAGFDPCHCEADTGFPIWHSNPQNPESKRDAYRNFKTNGYFDIPTNLGKPQKMFVLGNSVYLQTSDAMLRIAESGNSLQTEGSSVYLESSGQFLRHPQLLLGTVPEGEGGTRDPNACEVTKYGYISIDVEARKIYRFTGSEYQPLGDFGMSKFLENYMGFEAGADVLRDEKAVDGIGYSIGVDNTRDIVFITKTDKPSQRSWTLAFDMANQCWLGFEYFTPLHYSWDRAKLWSYNGNTMWQHNKPGEFLTVYGKPVPMVIDFVINDQSSIYDAFKWRHTVVDADFGEWKQAGYINRSAEFFTAIGAYNSFQSSGLMPVQNHNELNAIDAIAQDPNVLPVHDIHRRKRFNSLIDKVITHGDLLFTTWDTDFFTEFNKTVLGAAQNQSNAFIDNYMVMRLVYTGDPNIRVLLKHVITEINSEQL